MRTKTAQVSMPMPKQVVDNPVENSPVPMPQAMNRPATGEQIKQLAYRKWEAAGRPPSDGVPFWLDAETELLHQIVAGHDMDEQC